MIELSCFYRDNKKPISSNVMAGFTGLSILGNSDVFNYFQDQV
jgi:hypothetical protein